MSITESTPGSRIKKLRTDLKMTQAQLAAKFRADTSTISKWESDIHVPEGTHLVELAIHLHSTPEYILHGKDSGEATTARLAALIGEEAAILHQRFESLSPANKVAAAAVIEGLLKSQAGSDETR